MPAITLTDVLNARGADPDAIVAAARYYLAERLQDPPPDSLRADLEEQIPEGGRLLSEVARSPLLLREVALGVLCAAWEEPGERPRVERALDDATGKLPAGDLLPLTITLVYGLHLALRTGRRVTTDEEGPLALILKVLEPTSEGVFTVILLDIQESSAMVPAEVPHAVASLLATVQRSLQELAVRVPAVIVNDRGDGFQLLVPEPAGALTPLVSGLPRLVSKRLSGCRVRMGIHSGRLRFAAGQWNGAPLQHLERMTNADEIKQRLTASGKHLATVLSERVHWETVHEGYAEPTYDIVRIHRRETTADVWLMLS